MSSTEHLERLTTELSALRRRVARLETREYAPSTTTTGSVSPAFYYSYGPTGENIGTPAGYLRVSDTKTTYEDDEAGGIYQISFVAYSDDNTFLHEVWNWSAGPRWRSTWLGTASKMWGGTWVTYTEEINRNGSANDGLYQGKFSWDTDYQHGIGIRVEELVPGQAKPDGNFRRPTFSYQGIGTTGGTVTPPPTGFANPGYPRLAIYKLGGIGTAEAGSVSRFDIIICGPENANSAGLGSVLALNGSARVLFYRASQEAEEATDLIVNSGTWSNSWYLYAANGTSQTYQWSDTHPLFNISGSCPWVNGRQIQDVISDWTAGTFLNTGGTFAGVFYDNVRSGQAWDAAQRIDNDEYDIDMDRNGVNDHNHMTGAVGTALYDQGMIRLMDLTRQKMGTAGIIVGNTNGGYGNFPAIRPYNNGRLTVSDWSGAGSTQMPDTTNINDYTAWCTASYQPPYSINMAQTYGPTGYDVMRGCLCATLMGDGWHGAGYSDDDWSKVYWFDEYSVNAGGTATGDATGKGYLGFPKGTAWVDGTLCWHREYDNGLVVYNPRNDVRTVSLGSTYKRITGLLETTVNSGGTTNSVTLGGRRGQVFLNQ